jgi:Flp pilus assembly pilin Flp
MKILRFNAKGASLIEYSMLAGLISVISIAAVFSTGQSITGIFENIESEVASANQAAGNGSSSETSEVALATWSITAAHFDDGAPYRGYKTTTYTFGTRDAWSGMEVVDFYTYDHDADPSYLNLFFQGDESSNIDPDMILRCEGQADVLVSDSDIGVNYHAGSDVTQMVWSNTPFLLNPGSSYSCTFIDPQ